MGDAVGHPESTAAEVAKRISEITDNGASASPSASDRVALCTNSEHTTAPTATAASDEVGSAIRGRRLHLSA